MSALDNLKLGRRARSPWNKKAMAKFLRVNDFLRTLPEAPEVCDWTSGIREWGMMLNDVEGICTCAELGHQLQAWTAASGKEVTVPDSAIQKAYMEACGYVPGDPSTDQGGIIADVLDYFRDVGVGGFKIDAHAEVNMTQLRVQQAIYTFGGVDFGLDLPLTADDQYANGEPWDIVGDPFDRRSRSYPGSLGGHSVLGAFYAPGGVDCITWGGVQRMTWRFLMFYGSECHAAIAKCFTKSPEPVNELVNDLLEAGT